jgi:hypothetical protein
MSEIEQRLRAALHAAVDEARPPSQLPELIMQRHRRYLRHRRTVSATMAAALALAVPAVIPLVSTPARHAHGQGRTPAPSHRSVHRRQAQPGTLLQDCQDQIGSFPPGGGADWRGRSVHAGPLWFLDARPALYASRDISSPLPFGTLPVIMADGSHASVKVVGPSVRYFRFLYGPANGGGRYTLSDGQDAITFTACQRGQDTEHSGLTEFWGGFVVARVPECVSLEVLTQAAVPPVRLTLAVGSGACRQRG